MMPSKEVVLIQRITKKQNKFDFSVIENTILGKRDKIIITGSDLRIRASKIIFNGLHGYAFDFCGNTLLKKVGLPDKIIMEKVDKNNILVFICYNSNDYNIEYFIKESSETHCIGIDMGKKNTFAVVNNFGEMPFLIKGTMMNRLYNDDKNRFFDNLKKAIAFLQLYIDKNNIKIVYIGNMYKYSPYDIILKEVKKLKNVDVVVVDESNTSKASFLDKDILCGECDFSGKRITRSQYISKDGIVFSADINAAYNILLKGNPFALYKCEKPLIDTIDYDIDSL